jgi:hypothetical protein
MVGQRQEFQAMEKIQLELLPRQHTIHLTQGSLIDHYHEG